MKKLTAPQKTIINELIAEFEKFNSVVADTSKFKYFNPTPIVNEVIKDKEERDMWDAIVRKKIHAMREIAIIEFCELTNDLSSVDNLKVQVSHNDFDKVNLYVGGAKIPLITCSLYGSDYITQQKGSVLVPTNVTPSYTLHDTIDRGNYGSRKTLEEVIAIDEFKNQIEIYIKQTIK